MRKIEYDDYERDEFEQAYKEEVYDYENPVCEKCGHRMIKITRSIREYGYYTEGWECQYC